MVVEGRGSWVGREDGDWVFRKNFHMSGWTRVLRDVKHMISDDGDVIVEHLRRSILLWASTSVHR